ncbi:hypothetical protein LTR60_006086 [Cryomyces antarcticus]|nr:hypothetical protein LTR60_006086 [Cryomyces antarcticus]
MSMPSLLELSHRGKAARAQSADAPSSSPSSSASPAADDPFDFSVLESDIAKVHERLQHELKKLRSGGRFNPEVLEALRVHLVKGGKESVRLGDVAQVIPKGRVVQLVVGEKDVRTHRVPPIRAPYRW